MMTVQKLIDRLKLLPPDLEVVLPADLGYADHIDVIDICYINPDTDELFADQCDAENQEVVKCVSFGIE